MPIFRTKKHFIAILIANLHWPFSDMEMQRLLLRLSSCRGLCTARPRPVSSSQNPGGFNNARSNPTQKGRNLSKLAIGAAAGAMVIGGGAALVLNPKSLTLKAEVAKKAVAQKPRVFSLDELGEMCENGRIVVAYQGSLYDMSDFSGHPGGVGRLQMAAGNDLEVYWKVYTQHNRGHVTEHMKPYKIGEVSAADMATITSRTHYDESAYSSNPEMYPDLLTNTRYPYNAEGRLSELTDSWETPIGKHFVRNHCAVPDIDPKVILISGKGKKSYCKYVLTYYVLFHYLGIHFDNNWVSSERHNFYFGRSQNEIS